MHACRHTEKKRKLSVSLAQMFAAEGKKEQPVLPTLQDDEQPAEVMLSPRGGKQRKLQDDAYATLNNMCTDEEAEAHSQETIREMGKRAPNEKQLSKLLQVKCNCVAPCLFVARISLQDCSACMHFRNCFLHADFKSGQKAANRGDGGGEE